MTSNKTRKSANSREAGMYWGTTVKKVFRVYTQSRWRRSKRVTSGLDLRRMIVIRLTNYPPNKSESKS